MSDTGNRAPMVNTPRGLQPIGREIDVELHDHFKPFVDRHRRALVRHRIFRVVYNTLYGLALLLVVTMAGYLVACFFDYTPPSESKVELVNPSIRPGEDLRMRVVPNRRKLCAGKVTFRAYDRNGNIINESETAWSTPVAAKPGRDLSFNRDIRIGHDAVPSERLPDGLAADAVLRIKREYQCPFNILHLKWPITEVSPDMPFTILPKDATR